MYILLKKKKNEEKNVNKFTNKNENSSSYRNWTIIEQSFIAINWL